MLVRGRTHRNPRREGNLLMWNNSGIIPPQAEGPEVFPVHREGRSAPRGDGRNTRKGPQGKEGRILKEERIARALREGQSLRIVFEVIIPGGTEKLPGMAITIRGLKTLGDVEGLMKEIYGAISRRVGSSGTAANKNGGKGIEGGKGVGEEQTENQGGKGREGEDI